MSWRPEVYAGAVMVAQVLLVTDARSDDFKFHCPICGSTSHGSAYHRSHDGSGSNTQGNGDSGPGMWEQIFRDNELKFPAEIQSRMRRVYGPPVSKSCATALWSTIDTVQEFDHRVRGDAREFVGKTYLKLISAPLEEYWAASNTPLGFRQKAFSKTYHDVKKWIDYIKDTNDTFENLSHCTETPGCSLMELARELNGEIRAWLKLTAEGSTVGAVGRVRDVSNSLHQYAGRLQSSFQANAAQAVACTED